MNPKKWGKSFWILIIYVVQRKSLTKMKHVLKFLEQLEYVLPCIEMCRPNYKRHLRNIPKDPYYPETLLRWLYSIYSSTLEMQRRQGITYELFLEKIDKPEREIKRYIKKALKYTCEEEDTSRSDIRRFFETLAKLDIIGINNSKYTEDMYTVII